MGKGACARPAAGLKKRFLLCSCWRVGRAARPTPANATAMMSAKQLVNTTARLNLLDLFPPDARSSCLCDELFMRSPLRRGRTAGPPCPGPIRAAGRPLGGHRVVLNVLAKCPKCPAISTASQHCGDPYRRFTNRQAFIREVSNIGGDPSTAPSIVSRTASATMRRDLSHSEAGCQVFNSSWRVYPL